MATAKNFESRLIAASSPETLKLAKQLLKNDLLFGVRREPDGRLAGVFQEKNHFVQTSVRPGEPPTARCSCRRPGEQLCEHAVAILLYCGRFKGVLREPDDSAGVKYAGLKFEDFTALSKRVTPPRSAWLTIEALSAFPHVPSKWENAVLNLRLHAGEREYLGNLNNLRQLYFDKVLSAALKLDQFSLHDQQIIRFLAVNGEAENSTILLNSEQAAEFFHCLIGFEHFTLEGRKLFVRPDRAEAVILREPGGKLMPGIRVNGAVIPIVHAKVITGRSGCWVGCHGEYFFVPATVDIGWLRNFFRNGLQPATAKTGDWPLPVIAARGETPPTAVPRILLGGGCGADGALHLKVTYLYDRGCFAPRSGRLLADGSEVALRDAKLEREFELELEMFGFTATEQDFTLDRLEAIGVFLDQLLPDWVACRPGLGLEGGLARTARGGAGLEELKVSCRVLESDARRYLLSYDFQAGEESISFSELLALIRGGHRYALTPERRTPIRLSPEFRNFLPAVEQIVHDLDEKNHTFELPFFAVNYFRHLAGKLPGALPEELTGPFEAGTLPAPAASEFAFRGELRSYQREGRDWLLKMTDHHLNVILADEMGLGKTIQLLSVLAARHQRSDPPALVICPASLVVNWERECRRFVPDFRVVAPTGAQREEIWNQLRQYDLVVISYAAARRDVARLRKLRFSYLVLDEAQHIKNPGTANAQDCKAINADHRIVLTGTPLENAPEDLWSIFDFLHHGLLGSFAGFRKYYADLQFDSARQEDLAARVAPFIKRRTKQEVARELPPKQEITLYCELEPEQRKLYDEVLTAGQRQLAALKPEEGRGNTEIFTTLLRLRQICCHPELLPGDRGRAVPSAKMELFQELVLEHLDSGHKILVFSQFTTLLGKISEWLDQAGIRYEYLDGGTRNRQQRVDRFNQDPTIPLFLLSLKAGGTGLNLTAADTVIIFDPWWNPAAELQAADRTHRIGQTRPVSSLKLLVRDSIEEKMLALQQRKQELFDQVIDNPNGYGEKLTLEELRYLLT